MITLEEITFNSLMPWSYRNHDDFLYDELNAELIPASHHGPGAYFTKLSGLFSRLALKPLREVTAEWKMFAGAGLSAPEGLLKALASCRHPHPKVRFYALLVAMIAKAETAMTIKFTELHPADHLRRFRLARLTTRLERIIATPNPDTEHCEEDLSIAHLVKFAATAIYLDTLTRYYGHIQTERLKLTPEAIFEQLAMIRLGSDFAAALVDGMLKQYHSYFTKGIEACKGKSRENSRRAKVTGGNNRNTADYPPKTSNRIPDSRTNAPQDLIATEAKERIIESREVMELLGISKSTLKRYRDNGTIPYSRPASKGKVSYRFTDIERLAKTTKMNRPAANK